MAFQPAGNLSNRTFLGLIIAQFLAGFNDQAIHAAAMFYAIRKGVLAETQAIVLMPILFYAPWAIFCTISGYLADRYSKTTSLVVWKVAEVVISVVLLVGFIYGASDAHRTGGVVLVMSCVFLMGTHAAFFAPAKYGAMPEILQPHVLSKGNGVLESTTFLAAILGTVSGGVLSDMFHEREEWIGVVLIALSVVGVLASLMIARLPPANPGRLFPTNLFKPLIVNLGTLLRARPLALSVLGIAFFIFMVSYMRAAVYMHGETRNPHWRESFTSLVVATVALGVGLGSPLAGLLSGGKVELGMVPLACLGMMAALGAAAATIEHTAALVVTLIVIGFFSGFYMVPLYTLLQHRAPKQSKGDLIATSNFINVTGAISASLLFGLLVYVGRQAGLTPPVRVDDRVAAGRLEEIKRNPRTAHVTEIKIREPDGQLKVYVARSERPALDLPPDAEGDLLDTVYRLFVEEEVVEFEDDLLATLGSLPAVNDPVVVSRYDLRGVVHYQVRGEGQPLKDVYDNEVLPRFLFLGAALMTLGILLLLWRKLPDLFVRMLFWLRGIGRYRIRAVGTAHLPTTGPVLLATNAAGLDASLQLVSATDRHTRVLVAPGAAESGGLVRRLAGRTSLVELPAGSAHAAAWDRVRQVGRDTLAGGDLLAVSVAAGGHDAALARLVQELQAATGATLLPVYCGPLDPAQPQRPAAIRVVFGEPLSAAKSEVQPAPDLPAIRRAIDGLGDWIRTHDDVAEAAH